MSKINAICVYCASGPGTNPAFVEAAIAFGRKPSRLITATPAAPED